MRLPVGALILASLIGCASTAKQTVDPETTSGQAGLELAPTPARKWREWIPAGEETIFGSPAKHATDTVRWNGYSFQQVESLSALPEAIQKKLRVSTSGLGGVADKNAPFNRTDLVDSALPMRRLLAAGHSGTTWLVALEQGGIGYSVAVYLFSGAVQNNRWTLLSRPLTLEDVAQQLPVSGVASGPN